MAYLPRWQENEERVLAPARFISAMFTCNPSPPNEISLAGFIAHTMNRTQLPAEMLTAAVVLLHRLHTWNPDHHGSSGHRLFLAALMVAHKFLCDDPFSNKSWTIVGRVLAGLSLRQVNMIEQELLGYLGWEIIVSRNDIRVIERELHNRYSYHYLASPPLTPIATTPLDLSPLPVLNLPLPSSPPTASHLAAPPLTHSSSSSSSTSSASSAFSVSFPSSPITPPTPLSPQHGYDATNVAVDDDRARHPFSPSPTTKADEPAPAIDALMEKFMVAHASGAFSGRRPRRERQNAV